MSAVKAAIQKYEAYPDEARNAWEALARHRDGLITKANTDLKRLGTSTDVDAIDKGITRYAAYGADVTDAMGRLRQHFEAVKKEVAAAVAELADADPRVHARRGVFSGPLIRTAQPCRTR